jgi:hypothetical protein
MSLFSCRPVKIYSYTITLNPPIFTKKFKVGLFANDLPVFTALELKNMNVWVTKDEVFLTFWITDLI